MIPSKIGKIVEEDKSQNLEKENEMLRKALRESQRGKLESRVFSALPLLTLCFEFENIFIFF